MVINMYFSNNFIIYSILGFIMESTIYKFRDSIRHSGILFGPYTLVYGFGILAILIIYKIVNKRKINKFLKGLIMFILFIVFLTLIEWLGGNIINGIFNIDLWDYTKHKYNLGKYVSIPISISWGILGLIFIYFLKPMSDRLIKIIPKKFTDICLFIIFIDSICTLVFK